LPGRGHEEAVADELGLATLTVRVLPVTLTGAIFGRALVRRAVVAFRGEKTFASVLIGVEDVVSFSPLFGSTHR
jgi:hypothetical protein